MEYADGAGLSIWEDGGGDFLKDLKIMLRELVKPFLMHNGLLRWR